MKRKLLLNLALCTLAGCSLPGWFPFQTQADPSKESVEDGRAALAPSSVSQTSGMAEVGGVEVLWAVPLKAVEVYHLSYGYIPDKLDQTIIVPIDKLEKIDHPNFGPVFKYRLSGVDKEKDIYVSVRAENRLGLSAPSPAQKIPGLGIPGLKEIATKDSSLH